MTRHLLPALLLAVTTTGTLAAAPATLNQLLDGYRAGGAAEFSPDRGGDQWARRVPGPDGGPRSCTTCHGEDLRQSGRHATTGKAIEPMAPSAQANRLSDPAKVEKWFKRNCTWTWGRECTAQEKGDFLTYLRNL